MDIQLQLQFEELLYDQDPIAIQDWISKGGDPSELGNWALDYAKENNLKTIVQILERDPRVMAYKKFMQSIKTGNLETVQEYYRNLTAIMDQYPINHAVLLARNKGFDDIEQFLVEDPRILLQHKIHDNAFPHEIKELLENPLVFDDPGLYEIISKKPDYKKEYDKIVTKKNVIDTSIALRGLQTSGGRLPVHVVEEILHHAYNTRSTLELSEVIARIQNIFNR